MVVLEGLEWQGLYYNTLGCIAEMRDELYCKTVLYCGWKGCRRQNRIAIQNCIVTGGMGAGKALGAASARAGGAGRAAQALACGTGAQRVAWALGARPGRWARGLAKGCALGALSLFLTRFDSVFFLSQIFGHCS